METTNALSQGNAWRGHVKLVAIKGRLFDNGTEIGNFIARRNSIGGVAGGAASDMPAHTSIKRTVHRAIEMCRIIAINPLLGL